MCAVVPRIYLGRGEQPVLELERTRIYGGKPFAEDLKTWIAFDAVATTTLVACALVATGLPVRREVFATAFLKAQKPIFIKSAIVPKYQLERKSTSRSDALLGLGRGSRGGVFGSLSEVASARTPVESQTGASNILRTEATEAKCRGHADVAADTELRALAHEWRALVEAD